MRLALEAGLRERRRSAGTSSFARKRKLRLAPTQCGLSPLPRPVLRLAPGSTPALINFQAVQGATMEHEARHRMSTSKRLLVVHVLFWTAVAIAAYVTAGPYTFASCGLVVLAYFPIISILLFCVAGWNLAYIIWASMSPSKRRKKSFSAASHGLIFFSGFFGSSVAAYAAAGQVSCL